VALHPLAQHTRTTGSKGVTSYTRPKLRITNPFTKSGHCCQTLKFLQDSDKSFWPSINYTIFPSSLRHHRLPSLVMHVGNTKVPWHGNSPLQSSACSCNASDIDDDVPAYQGTPYPNVLSPLSLTPLTHTHPNLRLTLSWGDHYKGDTDSQLWVRTTVTIHPESVFYRSEPVVDMLLQEVFSILAPQKRLRDMRTSYYLPPRAGLSLEIVAQYHKKTHILSGEINLFLNRHLVAIGEADCNPYDYPLDQAQRPLNRKYETF
jgi:hypothetical protein